MDTLLTVVAFLAITAISVALHLRTPRRGGAGAAKDGAAACPRCRTAIPAGAERCPRCGVPIQA
jgi:uncharacterized paraquat-inducible protein A